MLSASNCDGKNWKDEELKLMIGLEACAVHGTKLEKSAWGILKKTRTGSSRMLSGKLFPSRELIPVMIDWSGIGEEKKVNVISREERQKLKSI